MKKEEQINNQISEDPSGWQQSVGFDRTEGLTSPEKAPVLKKRRPNKARTSPRNRAHGQRRHSA